MPTREDPGWQQQREGLRLAAAIKHYFPLRSEFAQEAGVTGTGLQEQVRGKRFILEKTLVHYGVVLGYQPPEAFAAWVRKGEMAPIFEGFERELREKYKWLFDPPDNEPPRKGASRAAVPRPHDQLKVAGRRG